MTLYSLLLLFVSILPCVVAFLSWVNAPSSSCTLRPARNALFISMYCFAVLLLAFTPATYFDGSDKGRYMYQFDNILSANVNELTKDIGWHYFVKLCYYITFGISEIYFLITASIFASAFYFFSKEKFGKDNVGYFLLMTMGLLGFGGFTNNVIRNGIAVALCLYALIVNRNIFKIALSIVAYSIHGSTMILIVSYLVTVPLKSYKLPFLFWCLCLVLSFARIDVSTFFQIFGALDERVTEYTGEASADTLSVYSKAGMFRWDFLLYSAFPIFISRYWIKKYKYDDRFYIRIVNMYLLCNALWLLIIRQAYCDRFAFLSWLMIPIVTLYPVLKNEIQVTHPNSKVYLIITIITGVHAGVVLKQI